MGEGEGEPLKGKLGPGGREKKKRGVYKTVFVTQFFFPFAT